MTTPEGRKAMTEERGSFQASRGSSECRKPVNLLKRDEKIDAWYRLQLTDTWCIGAKNIKGSNPDCNEVFVGRAPFQACHFWCHLRNENINTANTNTTNKSTNTTNLYLYNLSIELIKVRFVEGQWEFPEWQKISLVSILVSRIVPWEFWMWMILLSEGSENLWII